MTSSAPINPTTIRQRPLVWLKELVLYKSIDPVTEIRRMDFSTGLNIIQGTMSDVSEPFESGHGIGKTTLCRLIRYCLGEKTFGQNHVVAEVKHCLPNSYVGAVFEVAGADWALLRPLGSRRKQVAHQCSSLTDLLQNQESRAYEDFLSAVEEATLSDMPNRAVLSAGHSVEWLHILAMCSRDQESRYDLWWNWRHTRSDSTPLKLSKPKVDAGLCVRLLLSLLKPEETTIRADLERLESDLPGLRERIKEKEAEPKFHITRLRTKLKNECGIIDAEEAPLDDGTFLSLLHSVKKKQKDVEEDLAKVEEKLPPLDRQISLSAISLKEQLELFEQQSAASEATADGTENIALGLDDLKLRKDWITDRLETLCKAGQILYRDCQKVTDHLSAIDDDLDRMQKQSLPEIAKRDQVSAELSRRADRQQTPIDQLRKRLEELTKQKNDLLENRIALNRLKNRVPQVWEELVKWNGTLEGTVPSNELESLKSEETNAEQHIDALQKQLDMLLKKQAELAQSLTSRFDRVVKSTINSEFNGQVAIDEEGVSFRIYRGNSLFGEAYETLAVLLADIALLSESSLFASGHPGFLIHDSPREADLNIRIYERLLEAAASLNSDVNDGSDVPFQYIVTTTTPPPTHLDNTRITKHLLGSGEDSLFRMQLEVGDSTLFGDDKPE